MSALCKIGWHEWRFISEWGVYKEKLHYRRVCDKCGKDTTIIVEVKGDGK
tara:strand:+ start:7077 stop:7226 length:150 start_codon:yes stop_codon:yes gene_type:complete